MAEKTIGDKIQEEMAKRTLQHRFSHYRFDVECAIDDDLEELQKGIDNFHLD